MIQEDVVTIGNSALTAFSNPGQYPFLTSEIKPTRTIDLEAGKSLVYTRKNITGTASNSAIVTYFQV